MVPVTFRVMVGDTPGASAIGSFANNGLKSRGTEVLDTVLMPVDPSADDSALIQKAITGADGLVLILSEELIKKVVPEIRAAGFKGALGTPVTVLDPKALKGLPELQELVFVGGMYPATAKKQSGIARFNADMRRFAPKNASKLEGAIVAWDSVQIVADALKQAPTIDGPALAKVLNTYQVTIGAGPDIDFSSGGNLLGIPRLFTTLVVAQRIKNDAYVTDGDLFDPTLPPSSK